MTVSFVRFEVFAPIRIVALGLLASVLLSAPLWGLTKAGCPFPGLPFVSVPALAGEQARLWQGIVLVALALATAIFAQRRLVLAALLLGLAWLVVQDLNRLQPWVYFYGLAGLLLLGKTGAAEKQNALRWLVVAVYAWSGFNKLTPWYAEDNFPWLCDAFGWLAPIGKFPAAGYASAVLEMALAAGLLWPRSRPTFRWIVVFFHGYIIATLVALDWNYVVIPWNLALAGLVMLIFGDKKPLFWSKNAVHVVVLGLAWLLPLFNLAAGRFETLSWKMYSNTQPEATFFARPGGLQCDTAAAGWNKFAFDNNSKILLDDWAMAANNTPMYSSPYSFRQAGRWFCACTSEPETAGLIILRVNRWDKSEQRLDTLSCRELLGR